MAKSLIHIRNKRIVFTQMRCVFFSSHYALYHVTESHSHVAMADLKENAAVVMAVAAAAVGGGDTVEQHLVDWEKNVSAGTE